jgi:hypothetical protein
MKTMDCKREISQIMGHALLQSPKIKFSVTKYEKDCETLMEIVLSQKKKEK